MLVFEAFTFQPATNFYILLQIYQFSTKPRIAYLAIVVASHFFNFAVYLLMINLDVRVLPSYEIDIKYKPDSKYSVKSLYLCFPCVMFPL